MTEPPFMAWDPAEGPDSAVWMKSRKGGGYEVMFRVEQRPFSEVVDIVRAALDKAEISINQAASAQAPTPEMIPRPFAILAAHEQRIGHPTISPVEVPTMDTDDNRPMRSVWDYAYKGDPNTAALMYDGAPVKIMILVNGTYQSPMSLLKPKPIKTSIWNRGTHDTNR